MDTSSQSSNLSTFYFLVPYRTSTWDHVFEGLMGTMSVGEEPYAIQGRHWFLTILTLLWWWSQIIGCTLQPVLCYNWGLNLSPILEAFKWHLMVKLKWGWICFSHKIHKLLGISTKCICQSKVSKLAVGHLDCFLTKINFQTGWPTLSSNSTHIFYTVTGRVDAGTEYQT